MNLVDEYQCPGCSRGVDTSECGMFKNDHGCENHRPGTFMSGAGRIMIGLPKGFNRTGPVQTDDQRFVYVYETYEDFINDFTPKFNVIVWKHLDVHKNTLLRVYSPRINVGRTVVIRGDQLELMSNVTTITEEDREQMD